MVVSRILARAGAAMIEETSFGGRRIRGQPNDDRWSANRDAKIRRSEPNRDTQGANRDMPSRKDVVLDRPAVVACLVATAATKSRIAALLQAEKLTGLVLAPKDITDGVTVLRGAAALVYDLSPWDESAIALLRAVRARHVTLPVLLYTPPRPVAGRLLVESGRVPLVWGWIEQGGPEESTRLRSLLREVLDQAPAAVVFDRMRVNLTNLPPQVLALCKAALRHLAGGDGEGKTTVAALARELELGTRALERTFKLAGTMTPKELVDWTVLLYAVRVSSVRGEWTYRVAPALGLERNRLRRTYRRLGRLKVPLNLRWPFGAAFATALEGFAKRCREAWFSVGRARWMRQSHITIPTAVHPALS